jgi:hypothetical protein
MISAAWQPFSQPWNKQDGYDQTFVISKSGDLLRLAAEARVVMMKACTWKSLYYLQWLTYR